MNSLSSLDLQKTQLSSKLHLVSISIPTLTGIFFLPFFSLILVHFQPWLKKFRIIVLSPTQITQMSVYEISLTEKDEPMLMTMRFCIVIVLCMCYVYEVFAQQCKEDEHAISGMMLRGHTFRTMRSSIAFECHQACYNDFRCHSFNYVISEEVCELNNRTKEARPENFVPNFERYYVRSNKKRGEIEREVALVLVFIEGIWTWYNYSLSSVPLGSVPEFPAETCKEIKASEEGKATSGSYWLDSIIKGKTLLVPCDMETAGKKTRLLVFVDISVIKLDKALYYFGKVDPCQVVLSYNIWSLSMRS